MPVSQADVPDVLAAFGAFGTILKDPAKAGAALRAGECVSAETLASMTPEQRATAAIQRDGEGLLARLCPGASGRHRAYNFADIDGAADLDPEAREALRRLLERFQSPNWPAFAAGFQHVRDEWLRLLHEAERLLQPCESRGEDPGWFRKAVVARGLGVSKPTVERMIRRRELRTNGEPGRACRVDPASILAYCERQGVTWNDDEGEL